MKKQVSKITVYDNFGNPATIRTYKKDAGAPYEIHVDETVWWTCENGVEVNDEIKYIMSLYGYRFFPTM